MPKTHLFLPLTVKEALGEVSSQRVFVSQRKHFPHLQEFYGEERCFLLKLLLLIIEAVITFHI